MNVLRIVTLTIVLAVSCAPSVRPRPQWKVYLATDAPIPSAGEQLLVEVLSGGADASSGRTAETHLIDGSKVSSWPISFGVIPAADGDTVRVRVRFYRLDLVGSNGLPQGTTLIDATATLPAATDGVVSVAMTLRMACFGVPAEVVARRTCDPSSGTLAAEPVLAAGAQLASLPAPGTWPPGKVVACKGPVPSGMTCVPGGAFLMGSVHGFNESPADSSEPEHFVQISPFALDDDEMTVAKIRPLVQSGSLSAPLTGDPLNAQPPECSYVGADDALNDAFSVNCITWSQANAACKLFGKRLPTEAEWEYAAGNLDLKTSFPWGGDDDPACSYGVVGRGRGLESEDTECSTAGEFGPVAGGSVLDVTTLGVRNLGGNMSEWVADAFESYAAPCWVGRVPLVDPVCTVGSQPGVYGIRGGSWSTAPVLAHSFQRNQAFGAAPSVNVGFRCAESF